MNPHQQTIKKINDYAKQSVPFFLITDFELQKPVLYTLDELEKEEIFFSFPNAGNFPSNETQKETVNFKAIHPLTEAQYQKGFDIVMKNLYYGNSFLVNYTCKTNIECSYSLKEIFAQAVSKYKIIFKQEWICFSPESFIRIENGEIFSFPMKGTIDADLPNAQFEILNNEKELAEHYTIVDLIRNDLSMVATNVEVEKFRYIDKIKSNNKTLLQVSSKIKGKLPKGYENTLGEILFALLPAGSVSGAPKKKTIDIIKETEAQARGYYTGVAFLFDGTNVDSCVLIRFIEKEKENLFYRSGGGITIHSQMHSEYQETLDKIYVPIY